MGRLPDSMTAGNNKPTNIPIMVITTNSSTSVNPTIRRP